MTSTAIRPMLWSGHDWVDRIHPDRIVVRGRAYAVAKRLFDLVVVLAAAPLWVPLLVFSALWIKLDDPSAPVLFGQDRCGEAGRIVRIHKFRTMVPNAEEMKWQLRHLNELEWPRFKITDDPRITRPGRWLRRTSIDELPQLIDVLTGRLSLVGPRPTTFAPEEYALWHTERLDAKPGITGLWQLYGRGIADPTNSSRLDIAYVQRRCFWMDLQILVRTVPAVLSRRGAW
jgi:lipopolysaccharide/colanic/teichoic acid biosynthesis glycosyltransferase